MKEHEEWLDRAESDLQFAEIGIKEGFYAHTSFLCQQAVEKALKSYLVLKAGGYPKIHMLTDLLSLCEQHEPAFNKFDADCRELDQYYTPARYPGSSIPLPKEADALKAFNIASNILKFVKKRIRDK